MSVFSKFLFPFFFLCPGLLPALSQENHYWAQQQGSKSTLMGGANVASIHDNCAIYYNPGAMAFFDNTSLSISANTYFLNGLNIKNGAGENLNLKSSTLDIVPSLLSGIIKNFEEPEITISYAILNTQFAFYDMALRHQMQSDVIPAWPGEENYVSGYRYYQRIRDDWLGLGSSKKLSDRVGIGMSMFATFFSQNYYEGFETSAIVYDSTLSDYNTIGNTSFAEEVNSVAVGLLWKFGIGINLDPLRIGFSLTTPRLELNFLGNARLYRSFLASLELVSASNPKIITASEKLATSYKSPWIFDLGLEYRIRKTTIATRIAYFTRIDPYVTVDTTGIGESSGVFFPGVNLGVPRTAHRAIVNLAVGIDHSLSEKVSLVCGFRTDFNYLDRSKLDTEFDFIPSLSNWDLYHFTGGVTIHLGTSELTFGLGYSRGRSTNDLQRINLTEPDLSLYLFGQNDNSASSRYFQLNAILGFLYLF